MLKTQTVKQIDVDDWNAFVKKKYMASLMIFSNKTVVKNEECFTLKFRLITYMITRTQNYQRK